MGHLCKFFCLEMGDLKPSRQRLERKDSFQIFCLETPRNKSVSPKNWTFEVFSCNSENMKYVFRMSTFSFFDSSIYNPPTPAAFWAIKQWITRVYLSACSNTEICWKGQKSEQMVTFKASQIKFMKQHIYFCKFPPQLWGGLFCQKLISLLIFEKSTKTFYS